MPIERTDQRAVLRGLLATLLMLVSVTASIAIVDRTFGVVETAPSTTLQSD